MIVTVTANPSLDRTVEVDELRRGAVLRAGHAQVEPGGKGVNVSRALAAHGHKTVAVVCAGGAEGQLLVELLDAAGVAVRAVRVGGETRINVTIAEPDGVVTKLNFPGPRLSAVETRALIAAVAEACEGGDWVAGCGSLPPGFTDDSYARLVTHARGSGVRVAVDSSGPALARCLPARPDLVKPNREELAECAATPVVTLGDAVRAAEVLRRRGARAVLASLGPDGAVLVDRSGAWHAQARATAARSSVGAGDALLAGFLAAGGEGPAALVNGVAWGTAATTLAGSTMPTPGDVERITVTLRADLDTDLTLAERS